MTQWVYAWRITGTCALCRPLVGGNLNSIFIDIYVKRCFFSATVWWHNFVLCSVWSIYCFPFVCPIICNSPYCHCSQNDTYTFNASIIFDLLAILSLFVVSFSFPLSLSLSPSLSVSLFYLNEPRTCQTLSKFISFKLRQKIENFSIHHKARTFFVVVAIAWCQSFGLINLFR